MVAKKNKGEEVDATDSIVFVTGVCSLARLSLRGLFLLLWLRSGVHTAPQRLSKLWNKSCNKP